MLLQRLDNATNIPETTDIHTAQAWHAFIHGEEKISARTKLDLGSSCY